MQMVSTPWDWIRATKEISHKDCVRQILRLKRILEGITSKEDRKVSSIWKPREETIRIEKQIWQDDGYKLLEQENILGNDGGGQECHKLKSKGQEIGLASAKKSS